MSKPTNPSIRNTVITFSAIILIAVFGAFIVGNDNGNVQRFKNAVMNLDKTCHTLTDKYDYWPKCGIRTTGGHLFSLISLKTPNRMLPCDLYVSGPHSYNRWDLKNSNVFGHYNPEAVSYLKQLAKKVVSDKQFVKNTEPPG